MQAILVDAVEAYHLITGAKTEVIRIWDPRSARGERILICSTAKRQKGYACGYALLTAELAKVTPYPSDADPQDAMFGWHLKKIRQIVPFAQRSRNRLSFFEVSDKLITEVKKMSLQEWVEGYYDPLRHW